jgi:hypothetical protein
MVDPDWGELIRSELDSYVPERLPARFVPGGRRQRRVAAVDWRPVAVTIAVLLFGLGFATVAGGPENIYRSVVQMVPSRNVTPTPEISSTPTPLPTATPTPNPARKPSPAPPAIPHSSSSSTLLPAATQPAGPTPPEAATPSPEASSTAADPSPSSNQICLLLVGCL